MNQVNKAESFEIPERIAVFEDHKTSAKTIALPFQFPDGKNGVIMISRLNKMPWTPAQTITKVTIEFK